MDVYNLGKVDRTTDGRDALFYGFNIIGVQVRPLVGFAFETQEEADAAHKAMKPIVAHGQTDYAYTLVDRHRLQSTQPPAGCLAGSRPEAPTRSGLRSGPARNKFFHRVWFLINHRRALVAEIVGRIERPGHRELIAGRGRRPVATVRAIVAGRH
jgi:hypothetical protein